MITCEFEEGNKADPGLRHVVVDVLIVKDDQILLTRRAPHLLEGGKWSLVGGFVSRDEKIIEAAVREALEETGWVIGDLELLEVIDEPNRKGEDRQNVSFVYLASPKELKSEHDDEVTELQWFNFSELPGQLAFDHERTIQLFLRGRKRQLKNNE